MRISRFSRKFHDPWGSKNGNRYGSPVRFQYLVGASGLNGRSQECDAGVDECRAAIDRPAYFESTNNKFARATKRSVERLRR